LALAFILHLIGLDEGLLLSRAFAGGVVQIARFGLIELVRFLGNDWALENLFLLVGATSAVGLAVVLEGEVVVVLVAAEHLLHLHHALEVVVDRVLLGPIEVVPVDGEAVQSLQLRHAPEDVIHLLLLVQVDKKVPQLRQQGQHVNAPEHVIDLVVVQVQGLQVLKVLGEVVRQELQFIVLQVQIFQIWHLCQSLHQNALQVLDSLAS